jgi:hypothetical protein
MSYPTTWSLVTVVLAPVGPSIPLSANPNFQRVLAHASESGYGYGYDQKTIKSAYKVSHLPSSERKFSIPRPVTGSQPTVASNPRVPHPEFVSLVTSWNSPAKLAE